MSNNLDFFKDKRVLVTGHTGFKGTWLCKILINSGADVTGYSLEPPTSPNLFELSNISENMNSVIGDVADLQHLTEVFDKFQPEIVMHLAAQPIVRESYKDPVGTYRTNVMGTVNVCECVRTHLCVKAFLNVTTDKVYKNNEWAWGYRENEPLDGYDPYSNSKSCSELVTHSYINSFFDSLGIAVSTARAGNVIGGGDFAVDRIIPDCIRAAERNRKNSFRIPIRNPYSVRPYQHVFEPLNVYLTIVREMYNDVEKAGVYNVGPDECDCVTTGELVSKFCHYWGEELKWEDKSEDGPHEATFLKLDCSLIKQVFGWKPVWNIDKAVQEVIEWTKVYFEGGDIPKEMNREIAEFFG